MQRIYLDHSASTVVEPSAITVAMDFIGNNYANPSALHSEGRKAKAAIEQSRKQIAGFLNCNSNEVFFCASATEANNTIIKSAVRSHKIQTIICSKLEHPCVANSIADVQKQFNQIRVCCINSLENGEIDLLHLENLLNADDSNKLVSVIHGHNELGFINNINLIAKLCKKYKALFHTDTVQTAAKYELNLKDNLIDYAVASAHKIGGIKGAGLMYINRKSGLNAYINGGGQERNMRAGTENVAAIVAFSESWRLWNIEQSVRLSKIASVKHSFVSTLKQLLPEIEFNCNSDQLKNNLISLVSLKLKTNINLATLLFKLDLLGLSVSAGAACSSGAIISSSTEQFLNLTKEYKTVRVSFSHYNTVEEVNLAAKIITDCIK